MSDRLQAEQQELFAAEARIEAAQAKIQQSWILIGHELRTIRDRRLYRATHESFEVYCRERWAYSYQRAYELIQAEGVVRNLEQPTWSAYETSGDPEVLTPPTHANHVRPLVGLPPERQREAWQVAQDTAPAGGITGAHVRRTVQALYTPPLPPMPTPSSAEVRRQGWRETFYTVTMDMSTFLRGLDENGGLAAVVEGWTLEDKQEWLERAANLEGRWAMFVEELQRLCQQPLSVMKGGLSHG